MKDNENVRDFELNKRILVLIEKILEITPYEFSKNIGNKRPDGLYRILKNEVEPSPKTMNKIYDVYPQYKLWLLTGDGDMLKKDKQTNGDISRLADVLPNNIQHITPQITQGVGIPYFDVDFVGGFDLVMNSQTVQPQFYINYEPFNDCTCWVNLIGDSMKGDSDKAIMPNSIIALKYERNWESFTLLNENYAIVTEDFRTVKMLGKGKDNDHFNMIPHNKYYSEQEIPKEMILHLFRVKGSIKKFF